MAGRIALVRAKVIGFKNMAWLVGVKMWTLWVCLVCVLVSVHVLDAVRNKEMITQNTHEEWLEEYGRNKRMSSASVPEEVKNLQDWSDSSQQ